jgi:hypothetical protein
MLLASEHAPPNGRRDNLRRSGRGHGVLCGLLLACPALCALGVFDCAGFISEACAAIFLSRNHFRRCRASCQAGGGDQGKGQFAHVFLLCVLVELALSLHPLPHFFAGASVVNDVVNISGHLA